MPDSNPPPPGLPDVDDPEALASWLSGIETESGRISARQALIIEVAEASHTITMLRARALPVWTQPSDRYRAYAVLGVGVVLLLASAVALSLIDPSNAAALAPFPIVCLLWFFWSAYEVVRIIRINNAARYERDGLIQAAITRRDIAKAHLIEHESKSPPGTT